MSDQVQVKMIELLGKPAAMVQVQFTRTIIVDAEAMEHIDTWHQAGLSVVKDFWDQSKHADVSERRFYVKPWAPIDQEINLCKLEDIASLSKQKVFFRAEGSATTGFTGYLTIGGQETIFDLSQANLPNVVKKIQAILDKSKEDERKGAISPAEALVLGTVCARMQNVTGDCAYAYDVLMQLRAEKDQKDRLIKQQELDKKSQKIDGSASETAHGGGGAGGLVQKFQP